MQKRKQAGRNKMPGLRLKGGIWQIEKRCKYAKGGWLRESTGTSSRPEAEAILIRRQAEMEEEARRNVEAVFTFEEGALRYLEEIAALSSAKNVVMHLDQLFPFIRQCPLNTSMMGRSSPSSIMKQREARHQSQSTMQSVLSQQF